MHRLDFLKDRLQLHSYAVAWTSGESTGEPDLLPSVAPTPPGSFWLLLALYPLYLVMTAIQVTSETPSLQVWKLMTTGREQRAHSN